MIKLVLLFFCLTSFYAAEAQYSVSSPDTKLRVSLTTKKVRNINTKLMQQTKLVMDIYVNGKPKVVNQHVNLVVYSHGHHRSFGKSNITDTYLTRQVIAVPTAEGDSVLTGLGSRCNRLILQTDAGILLEVLAFNQGVAYRFSVVGMTDEYKILNVTDVLPEDEANAILGTFTDDVVLPWRTMRIFNKAEEEQDDKLPSTRVWENSYPHTKLVSWRDALSSVSVGATLNWYSSKRWGGLSDSQSVYADFIYKHLYGGLSFTPCHELLYVRWDEDFDPFTKIAGSVHSWDVTGRFGYNLPVQFGRNVWSFSPYAAASYLHLRQHGKTHPLFEPLTNHDHYLVGLGLKIQYMMPERISLGIGYEHQFFTGKSEPSGRHCIMLSIGYGL